MELIGVFFFAVLGILATATSRQLADEFKAWTPRLIKHFIQRAVRQLPESQRERFLEEWHSHVDEIPGEVGKLIVAFGFLQASWKMSRGLTDDTTIAKRAFDLGLSAALLFISGPLFLVIAFLIRLFSDGPILVGERRVGYKCNTIRLLKFRTTTVPKGGPGHGVPHVTRIGRFLRRSSQDNLPMLLNVIRGQLAVVGPRPLLRYELDLIDNHMPPLSRRKNVKPGLVGWAAVNGFRGEATALGKLQREIELDLYYVDNRSFLLDVKILGLAVLRLKP